MYMSSNIKSLCSNKVELYYDLIYDIYKIISYTLKQNYIEELSYIILPNNSKGEKLVLFHENSNVKGTLYQPLY